MIPKLFPFSRVQILSERVFFVLLDAEECTKSGVFILVIWLNMVCSGWRILQFRNITMNASIFFPAFSCLDLLYGGSFYCSPSALILWKFQRFKLETCTDFVQKPLNIMSFWWQLRRRGLPKHGRSDDDLYQVFDSLSSIKLGYFCRRRQ